MPRFRPISSLPRAAVALTALIAIVPLLLSDASATPIASATVSEAPSGPDFQYSLTLKDNSATPGTAATAIGTFWFSWTPGQDYLHTSPLSVTSPAGWQDTITHGGSSDGYAIQWTTTSSTSDLAAGASLSGFGFISTDPTPSVFGNSFFYSTTPTLTSVAYEAAPFSDGGDTFVVGTPEPATVGFLGLVAVGMLARRRRARPMISKVC